MPQSLDVHVEMPKSSKMSIVVEVGHISGRTVALEAALDDTVEKLKRQAQIARSVGPASLLDSSGNVLDVSAKIRKARIQNGETLTFCQIAQTRTEGSYFAFAAILGDGTVVTWGDAECGGDSSAVHSQLHNACRIQATQRAFAAVLVDGSVVIWGDAAHGGDLTPVLCKTC